MEMKIREILFKKRYHFNLIQYCFLVLILIAIGAAILFFAGLKVFADFGNTLHSETGCGGIEACYTGKDFMLDIFCVELSSTWTRTTIKTPRELFQEGGDCKSISNAMMCICKAYDKECKFYTELYINKYTEEEEEHILTCILGQCISGHLGIRVKINDTWRVLN